MLVTIAAFLCLLGLGVWALGRAMDFFEVSTIGGVIILGVGTMVATHGLAYKSGELHTTGANNSTHITYQYATASMPTHLPLGILVMILGGVLVIRAINDAT